jgi:putative ABC transport system ATP-binding protein
MEPLIKVENLNIVFDQGTPRETHAIKDVSLEIYPGEYVIIFGPSGCGKSTLLYHIAGLDKRITSGSISIDGINIVGLPDKEVLQIRKKRMGMVFQAYNLINTIKVAHNVALPFYFQGKNNKETIKKAERKLDILGVLSQKDKFPTSLSGGQQQRVAIARALITNPDIIIADEPVGNLDFKSAYDVLTILADLNEKQKKTVVFVTHDMNYLQFADKVIYLWNGQLTKVEVNKRKITPQEKFGDVEKIKASESTRGLAHSLINFILEGEEKEAFGKRVEHKLTEFLMGEMSWRELIGFFASPIRLGGLGFPRWRVKKIEVVLKKMRMENNIMFFKRFHKIDKNDIVDIISHEIDFELDAFQKERLAEIIEFRVRDIVTEENMKRFLISPENEKGLNLYEKQADILNEKINIFVNLLQAVKTAQSTEKGHREDHAKQEKSKKE